MVEKNSGGTTIFTENLTYDVFGNLIGVAVNGTQQRWTVFNGLNPYMDFSGSGSLTQRILSDPQALDRYFATLSSSGTLEWLFTDNEGSTREVVSASGGVLDQITYYTYGAVLSQTNSANAPRFFYAGGEWDSNLYLYHFGARWYDPVDGRWTSQDPLGLLPSPNPYSYASNAPANTIDLTGLSPLGANSSASYASSTYSFSPVHSAMTSGVEVQAGDDTFVTPPLEGRGPTGPTIPPNDAGPPNRIYYPDGTIVEVLPLLGCFGGVMEWIWDPYGNLRIMVIINGQVRYDSGPPVDLGGGTDWTTLPTPTPPFAPGEGEGGGNDSGGPGHGAPPPIEYFPIPGPGMNGWGAGYWRYDPGGNQSAGGIGIVKEY